jgi:homoaconitase/3-isopropylmalate dehydratase large subunit
VGTLGAAGLLSRVGEVYGEWVEQAGFAERITLASMGTEVGAISLVIPGDDPAFQADAGAHYTEKLTIDIAGLTPCVALPGNRARRPVSEVTANGGVKIDSVFIGAAPTGGSRTCGRRRHPAQASRCRGVMLRVTPATKQVWLRA